MATKSEVEEIRGTLKTIMSYMMIMKERLDQREIEALIGAKPLPKKWWQFWRK